MFSRNLTPRISTRCYRSWPFVLCQNLRSNRVNSGVHETHYCLSLLNNSNRSLHLKTISAHFMRKQFVLNFSTSPGLRLSSHNPNHARSETTVKRSRLGTAEAWKERKTKRPMKVKIEEEIARSRETPHDALNRQVFYRAFARYSAFNDKGQKAGLHDTSLREGFFDICKNLPRARFYAGVPNSTWRFDPSELPPAQFANSSGELEDSLWYNIFCFAGLDRRRPIGIQPGIWKQVVQLADRDHFMLVHLERERRFRGPGQMFQIDLLDTLLTGTYQPWLVPLEDIREGYEIWRYQYKTWLSKQEDLDEGSAEWLAREAEKGSKPRKPFEEYVPPKYMKRRFRKAYNVWKDMAVHPATKKEYDAIFGNNPNLNEDDALRLYLKKKHQKEFSKHVTRMQQLEGNKQLFADLGFVFPNDRKKKPMSEESLLKFISARNSRSESKYSA